MVRSATLGGVFTILNILTGKVTEKIMFAQKFRE